MFTNVLLFGFSNQTYNVHHIILHFWFKNCIQKLNIVIPYDSSSYTIRKKTKSNVTRKHCYIHLVLVVTIMKPGTAQFVRAANRKQ
jgi:hypothetical protein